jgi:diguanylate cyclase (GGDEF)-like protein/PAS domain S-box-containing protein
MAAVGSATLLVAASMLVGVLLSPAATRSRRRTWLVGTALLAVTASLVPLAVLAGDTDRAPVVMLGLLALLVGWATVALRLRWSRPGPTVDPSAEDIHTLIGQTNDVILIVDDEDRIRFASPSARVLLGTTALHDMSILDLVPETERRAAQFLLRQARRGVADDVARADWTVRTDDGTIAQVEVSCKDLRADAAARGLVVTMRDVTTQRRLEHELTKRMLHDPVTGLPNNLLFVDRVQQAVVDGRGVTGVVVIDLDRFRMINEALGREEGDAVLTTVGGRLREAAGAAGLTARLGSDEFAVLVAHLDSLEAVEEVADRVEAVLAERLPGRADGLICTGSIGVATTLLADSGPELVRNAEQALEAAKAVGNGHWKLFEPTMTSAARHRMELRSALSRAVEDDALVLRYQPIVDLHDGHTAGFEALVRWRHPTRGLLSPGEFIDIAEETGLITSIGDHVLRTAIAAARTWEQAAPHDPPYVSVNVSARQFRRPGFVDLLGQRLDAARLAPGRLVVEITESLLLRDDDEVWEDFKRLRRQGIRIAIDDFGTGYSALGYLRQVPLDIVKLDRIFISTMERSRRQRDLVHGIVQLTRALNLAVVAEGIETERQRDIAVEVGCGYGQGYLFSRPMSDVDCMAWLHHAQI